MPLSWTLPGHWAQRREALLHVGHANVPAARVREVATIILRSLGGLAQLFQALGQLRTGTVLVAEHVERPRSLHVDPGLVVRLLRNGLAVQLQRVGHAALAHGHRGPHALPRVVAQVVLHVILEPYG